MASWFKSLSKSGRSRRVFLVVGLTSLLAIPTILASLYYYQGYVSVNGIDFYFVSGNRQTDNVTIYFNLEFFVHLRNPVLTTTVTNPRFDMWIGVLYIGSRNGTGGDLVVSNGVRQNELYYNLTFTFSPPASEVAEFCSVRNWQYLQNPGGSPYWVLTMAVDARAGWYQSQVAVSSGHLGCVWGWIT